MKNKIIINNIKFDNFFNSKDLLPLNGGIYCIVNENRCLYVGETNSFFEEIQVKKNRIPNPINKILKSKKTRIFTKNIVGNSKEKTNYRKELKILLSSYLNPKYDL